MHRRVIFAFPLCPLPPSPHVSLGVVLLTINAWINSLGAPVPSADPLFTAPSSPGKFFNNIWTCLVFLMFLQDQLRRVKPPLYCRLGEEYLTWTLLGGLWRCWRMTSVLLTCSGRPDVLYPLSRPLLFHSSSSVLHVHNIWKSSGGSFQGKAEAGWEIRTSACAIRGCLRSKEFALSAK